MSFSTAAIVALARCTNCECRLVAIAPDVLAIVFVSAKDMFNCCRADVVPKRVTGFSLGCTFIGIFHVKLGVALFGFPTDCAKASFLIVRRGRAFDFSIKL
jgi:hypothetical protein